MSSALRHRCIQVAFICSRFKDNVLMRSSENVILSVADRTHTVAIRDAQLHDAGLITVKAANVAGEISASARLTVRGNHPYY